jgi:hypothetical protein
LVLSQRIPPIVLKTHLDIELHADYNIGDYFTRLNKDPGKTVKGVGVR